MAQNVKELAMEMRAVAKGERRPSPRPVDQKARAFALSEGNQELMKAILDHGPESISELAEITERSQSNVSRSIQDLVADGLVRIEREGGKARPILVARQVLYDIETRAIAASPPR